MKVEWSEEAAEELGVAVVSVASCEAEQGMVLADAGDGKRGRSPDVVKRKVTESSAW
jgi:hypothetical protein